MNRKLQKWKTLKRKEVFSAQPWVKLFCDTVKLPGGRIIDDFYGVELPAFAMVCAQNEKGEMLFVRQYKHALGEVTLLFPTGFIETDESPEKAAKRELLEETGYTAGSMSFVGTFLKDGTRGCGRAYFFLAKNLKKKAKPVSDDMEISELVFMSVDETWKAIRDGKISLISVVTLVALITNPHFLKNKKK